MCRIIFVDMLITLLWFVSKLLLSTLIYLLWCIRAGHLPKAVPTLCHMCLFDHVEANGAGKAGKTTVVVKCKWNFGSQTFSPLTVRFWYSATTERFPKAVFHGHSRKTKTYQTKSLVLSSYEFKRPLYKGAWWRDFFLLPEDAEGLLREAKLLREDGTAAKVGTDKPPSPAVAGGRVGTTFPELLPLLVTALLPLPPFVLPVPPVLLLLLVLGTELAPPAFCCGRLLDIIQGRQETPQNRLRCSSKHPDSAAIWLL